MPNTERDWRQFALLLIDVQQDFWPEEQTERFPDFAANVARLLALCREESIEVIHLRASYKPDMSDWMAQFKLWGYIPCIEGTEGAEPLPCALERPGEKVIVKKTFDGFHNPALLACLQAQGRRFVLTAGLVTSICVLFTTISAVQLGFLAAVVEDCCAANPVRHKQTLDTYKFFDRVTVDGIAARHGEWMADLGKLRELESADQVIPGGIR